MGFVWLGIGLVAVGMIGSTLTLNRLADLKRESFEDPAAQQYLRFARLFTGVMVIGAIVAVISALRIGA